LLGSRYTVPLFRVLGSRRKLLSALDAPGALPQWKEPTISINKRLPLPRTEPLFLSRAAIVLIEDRIKDIPDACVPTSSNAVRRKLFIFIFSGTAAQRGLWPPRPRGFLITQRHATIGRTPLDELSARRRDLYLTTHNRQTFIPRWDSKPRSQQASGRRPTLYTTRSLETAKRK
jgi:hypothetical protein